MDVSHDMAPVRIRYHVPDKPEVIRYNDPLTDRTDRQKQKANRHRVHFNKKKKRKRDQIRDNVSDYEYDYSPRDRDFEHMRRSVPDKYWGPYNPEVYESKRRWDTKEDGKFYDFQYDSYRRPPYERDSYGGDYDYDYEYDRNYDRERRERDFRHDRGYDSDQGRRNHNGYDTNREFGHDGRYDTDYNRPHQYGFDFYRGPTLRERADYPHPSNDYHRRHPYEDRHTRRDPYDSYGYPPSWRPQYVQSEIILPRDRLRPLPYMGDPNRKPHEHRRVPAPPAHKPKMHNYHSPRHQVNHGHHRVDGVETYYSDPIDWYARARYIDDARVALIRKRQRNAHCGACPEKSSKYVPTMHYDELRCQNCLDRVRPTQDEILAYPWTVQTYRTNNVTNNVPTVVTPAFSAITPSVYTAGGDATYRTDRHLGQETGTNANTKLATGPSRNTNIGNDNKNTLPKSEPKEIGTKEGKSVTNNDNRSSNNNNKNSIGAITNAKVVADRAAKDKSKSRDDKTAVSQGKENKSVADKEPSAKDTKPTNGHAKSGTVATKHGKKGSTRPLSVVHENQEDDYKTSLLVEHNLDLEDYDDIRPQDSVSNVRLPPLRAYPIEPNMTGRYSPLVTRPRAETELTAYTYPSGRYFPSLEFIPPPPAQATPLPKPDTRRELSRRLRGEYLDWRSGRKYEYDINYRGRRIMGDRRPIR